LAARKRHRGIAEADLLGSETVSAALLQDVELHDHLLKGLRVRIDPQPSHLTHWRNSARSIRPYQPMPGQVCPGPQRDPGVIVDRIDCNHRIGVGKRYLAGFAGLCERFEKPVVEILLHLVSVEIVPGTATMQPNVKRAAGQRRAPFEDDHRGFALELLGGVEVERRLGRSDPGVRVVEGRDLLGTPLDRFKQRHWVCGRHRDHVVVGRSFGGSELLQGAAGSAIAALLGADQKVPVIHGSCSFWISVHKSSLLRRAGLLSGKQRQDIAPDHQEVIGTGGTGRACLAAF
jgi:hypothetical protein